MANARASEFFKRMDEVELRLCLRANRACYRRSVERFFTHVSRLGDGPLWYALIVALPVVYGSAALRASVHMALIAILGIVIYRHIKSRLVRYRPYTAHTGVRLGTAPLDQYSFPSGHTLHAVSFTLVTISYFPALGWILIPFAMLVACSRVLLGLHYPSDVAVGAVIGALLALASLPFA
jgi:undecaprenyl-diphosphatase